MSSKKPRILISTFTFPPESNGVANAAYTHARIFQEIGCELDILTSGEKFSHEQIDGMTVTRLPIYGNGHLLNPCRGKLEDLDLFLKEKQWDIVFTHCWQAWNTNLILEFFSTNQRPEKLVLVSHGVSTNTNYNNFPLNFIRRILWLPYRLFKIPKYLKMLTYLIVLWDHYDKDRFLDNLLAKKYKVPIKIIPNVARYDSNNIIQPQLSLSKDELEGGFLLSVGNYSKEKDEFFVLDAYRISNAIDVPLIFVGHRHNNYSSMLMRYAHKWNLKRVRFCENLAKEEIDWLYKRALLFLTGSKTECQPLVILDSLASYTPYISTDVGCTKKLAGGLTVKTSEEMANTINFLLNNPFKIRKLAIQGHYLYEKEFCFSSVKEKWNAALLQLLNND